jgi:hypothetical protein
VTFERVALQLAKPAGPPESVGLCVIVWRQLDAIHSVWRGPTVSAGSPSTEPRGVVSTGHDTRGPLRACHRCRPASLTAPP